MNSRPTGFGAAALIVFFCFSAYGDAPYVVTTLPMASPTSDSLASQYTAVGDALYFSAQSQQGYPAIYRWSEADGLDFVSSLAATSSYNPLPPPRLIAFGDKLLFGGYADNTGDELWISDGTPAGTTLLKDISSTGSSTPVPLFVAGGKAYFTAIERSTGRELWVTDGTSGGTTLLIDITGDSLWSTPTGFVEMGGLVYFLALNQLYVTDGTPAGTTVVATNAGGASLGVLGDRVYFLGSDLANGRELWSTDGTPSGTAIVKDINPGSASSWGGIATPFIAQGSTLLFIAENATNGRELWKTDGTEGGTVLVKDISPGVGSTQIERLTASTVGAFFSVDNTDLWVSDGTTGGTVLLEEYWRIMGLVAGTGGAYLVTSDGVRRSLNFSDGTENGTRVVPRAIPAAAHNLTATGGMVVFTGNGAQPWITDGSESGTHLIANISAMSGVLLPSWTRGVGNLLYLQVGTALYRSDGTAPGTFALGELADAYWYSSSARIGANGSTFLFFGNSGDESKGLWKTDGTTAGTSLVKEFARIDSIRETSAGYVLLVASETQYASPSLWRSDGTLAGTTVVSSHRTIMNVVTVAGRVYFLSDASWPHEAALWETGGTAATTRMIAAGDFTSLVTAGGLLYLVETTNADGAELWRSDGTADGTARVKDIRPGAASSGPSLLTAVGNLLFFVADDGVNGRQLWRSDGTEGGTFRVKAIVPDTWSASRLASGGLFYFVADDGVHGVELWRSDGTSDGTIRLTETGSQTWNGPLADVDGKLMFAGHDALGFELWESSGSVAGTFLSADLVPGAGSSHPHRFALTRDLFFFATPDARLWAMPRVATRLSVADVWVTEGNSGSTTLTFTVTRDGNVTGATTVDYTTADLTATAGSDYTAASGTLSFAAGESAKQIDVTILGDTTIEPNEVFALELSAATGATISRGTAVGFIDENDRAVALSVEFLVGGSGRRFRITNSGPSGATVSMRVSESPYPGVFGCDGKNPSICQVGFVPAGGSVDFTVSRSTDYYPYISGTFAPSNPPGQTLTATVSALENEADTTDNTVARMINIGGTVSLPAHLVAGTTSSAFVIPSYGTGSASLSLTGGVVVSPSSAAVDSANPVATFTMTVAPNAWGWSNVKSPASASESLFRIPIVLPSETVTLDTKMLMPTESSWYDFDDTIVWPVTVVGVLPDGTRPSGLIELLTESGTVVQTQTLNAGGAATFTLAAPAAGSHLYRFNYRGDARFNGLRVDKSFNVTGRSTSTQVTVVRAPCGSSQIIATVTAGGGHTPTGTVTIVVNGSTVLGTFPLIATATPGQARVSTSYSFPTSGYSISVMATYEPSAPPFMTSGDYEYVYPVTCPAPTVIASAASSASVSLIWSDVGADMYEVIRVGPAPGAFTSITTTAGTTYVDSSVAAGSSYIYRINAKSSDGAIRSTSASDIATTIIFTDDPIVFRSTRVKATHIIQLRLAANAVRALAGQAPLTFAPVAAGSPIRATEFNELRTVISNALVSALAVSPVTWIDTLSPGGSIKTMHIQQMRNVVK